MVCGDKYGKLMLSKKYPQFGILNCVFWHVVSVLDGGISTGK
jgi:hypothetical protein